MLIKAASLLQPLLDHILNVSRPNLENLGKDLLGSFKFELLGADRHGLGETYLSPPGQLHVYASNVACDLGIRSAFVLPLVGALGIS